MNFSGRNIHDPGDRNSPAEGEGARWVLAAALWRWGVTGGRLWASVMRRAGVCLGLIRRGFEIVKEFAIAKRFPLRTRQWLVAQPWGELAFEGISWAHPQWRGS